MKLANLITLTFIAVSLLGCRYMTDTEKIFASHIYEGQLNFSEVEIYSPDVSQEAVDARLREALRADLQNNKSFNLRGLSREQYIEVAAEKLKRTVPALVLKNRVYYSRDEYRKDFAEGFPYYPRVSELGLFAHELAHVWQYQNRARTGYSLLAVASEHLIYREPYDYVVEPGKKFLDYRFEQQAKMIEDWVRLYYSNWEGTEEYRQLTALISQELDLRSLGSAIKRAQG